MNQENQEEWRDIPGYEGFYQVSSLGRVRKLQTIDSMRRVHRSHIKKLSINNRFGYLQVVLYKNGAGRTKRVHCLVALAFLGERPTGFEVNHIDGHKDNNRLDNLEYCTPSQNRYHAIDTGLMPHRGETHPKAKLTQMQVDEIRALSLQGVKGIDLASRYGVMAPQISRIINNRRWSNKR